MTSINFFCAGNIGVREHVGQAGDAIPGHLHHFDHVTLFVQGRFRLRALAADGSVFIERDYKAGDFETIHAGVRHEITWLEAGKLWCVYAHRDAQGQVVERYQGLAEAYAAREAAHG